MSQKDLNIRKILGARIRQERRKRGLTIEQLAERLDLSPSFLGCVERGERTLSLENIYNISEFFDVTIDSLIKEKMPHTARLEEMSLLLKELDESEYHAIYKIAQAAKEHIKNSGSQR